MNQLMNFEGNQVEVFEFEGKVLFNPKDVGKCLDMSDATVRGHIRQMNENKRVKLTNSNVGLTNFRKLHNTGEVFITESGVYDLIFKSRKQEAIKFKDWVTDEVLPTIRKHGAYMTDEVLEKTLEDPDYMIGLLTKLKEEKNLRLKVEKERDLLIHDDKTYTTTELAKELGFRSANALNQRLHQMGIQYPMCGSWVLYSKYATEGYTELKQSYAPNGEIIYYTRWTGKGRYFLLKLFNKEQVA